MATNQKTSQLGRNKMVEIKVFQMNGPAHCSINCLLLNSVCGLISAQVCASGVKISSAAVIDLVISSTDKTSDSAKTKKPKTRNTK